MVASIAFAVALALGASRDRPPRGARADLRLQARAPKYETLCNSLLDADKSGDWWCFDVASGETESAAATVTDLGTPVNESVRVCPNGPDCTSIVMGRTAANSDGWQTGGRPAPTGDFSVCWLGVMGRIAANTFVSQYDDNGSQKAFLLDTTAGTTARFIIFKDDSTNSQCPTTGTLTLGARHLVCGTYDYVADNTSHMFTYIDDQASTEITNARGPIQATADAGYFVANRGDMVTQLSGLTEAAFYTETKLSSADVLRLAAAVGVGRRNVATSAVSLGSMGESVTMAGTSGQACSPAGNASHVSMLPAGRPCLNARGLLVEGASTNLALQSYAFDNASWTKTGVSAGANNVVAPDGTAQAETVTLAEADSAHTVSQTVTTDEGKHYTVSVWAKPVAMDWMGLDSDGTGTQRASFDVYGCTVEASTGAVNAETSGEGGGEWCRASLAFTSDGGEYTPEVAFADTQERLETGSWEWVSDGGGTMALWGAQIEQLPWTSSYIPTTTAAVTRAAQNFSKTFPVTWSGVPHQYCIGATVDLRPTWWSLLPDAGGEGRPHYLNQEFVSSGVYTTALGYPANYAELKRYAYANSADYILAKYLTEDAGVSTVISDGGTVIVYMLSGNGDYVDGGVVRAVSCYMGSGAPLELFVDKERIANPNGNSSDQDAFPTGGSNAYLRFGTFGMTGESLNAACYSHMSDVCVSTNVEACQ